MFSYLRYFAIACMLLIAAGAALLSVFFSGMNNNLLLDQNRQHVAAALGSYSTNLWPRYSSELIANPSAPPSAAFSTENKQFFVPQPMAKVTLFSPDVKRLYYSSTPIYVNDRDGKRITLFDLSVAQAGQSVARLLKDVSLSDSHEGSAKRIMLQVIAPILKPGTNAPEALAEIYVDVTDQAHYLNRVEYEIIGTMVITFLLMVGFLIFTTGRAETIITKQHEANLELTAAAAQAEAQSQNKSQFLASLSHELRTPLNSIIGFSDLLRKEVKAKLDTSYQEYVDDIHSSGRHLLSLINDILDYSKAEAGKLQVEWAETDATKIIRNSLRMVMPRAEAAQVMLIEDLPNHHLIVVTDSKKLKQVLLNLLSNAVKFTSAGGEVRCQAWVNVADGGLVIVVKDTGIGIAPKDISKVMTPFGQVDSALSRKYEGTGLGLPLAKKFVESMGGHFGIESELKVGTTITITLPKAPPGWQPGAHTTISEE